MSKWIKPSQLPERFFGNCWVVWKGWSNKVHPAEIYTVQNFYRGTFPEYWCKDGYYQSLKEDEYRVMILETPKATIEDFKDAT